MNTVKMTTIPSHQDYDFDDFDDRSIPGSGRRPSNPHAPIAQHSNMFAYSGSSGPSRNGSVSQSSSWEAMGELQPCWSIWSSTLPATSAPPPVTATPTAVPSQPSGPGFSGNLFPSTPPQPQWAHSPSLAVAKPQSTSLWFGSPSGSPPAASSFGSSFGILPQQQTQTSASGASAGAASGTSTQLMSPPLSPQTSAEPVLGSPPQVFAMDGVPLAPVQAAPTVQTVQVSVQASVQAAQAAGQAATPALGNYFENSRPVRFDVMPTMAELQGVIAATAEPLYFVQFKSGRMDIFTVSDKTVHPIAVGDLVVVDADRGRDVGKVVAANVPEEQAALVKWQQYHERQQVLCQCSASKEPAAALTTCTPKHILRTAQASEVRQLVAKQADEAKAILLCNQKARERQLEMSVVDAEFQWDRRKLTFFYRADQRVDFRDLVRELFRIYKTRIWMCAVA